MRFVADAMLGRLAKWLRFLGYDVLYLPDIHDAELIRIAREQDRCLLTRDTRLARRKGIPHCLLVFSNDPPGQLRELKKSSLLTGADPAGRCAESVGMRRGGIRSRIRLLGHDPPSRSVVFTDPLPRTGPFPHGQEATAR